MIELFEVSKSYGKNFVLPSVSLVLPDTGVVFLMGPNGAGKTTLLKAILDLEPHNGHATFDGKPIAKVYGEISVVYDDSPCYSGMTGYQNISMLCNQQHSRKEIADTADKFLPHDILRRRTRGYSYGQKKKLSIIIAFLNNSKYIFMDEVSNGLDYETMVLLREKLHEQAQSRFLLLTGHQFDFYNGIVDTVLLLRDGKVDTIKLSEVDPSERNLEAIYDK